MKAETHHHNIEEQFVFSDTAKKSIFTVLGIGLIMFVIGVALLAFGGDSHSHEGHALANSGEFVTVAEGHDHGHAYHWTNRLKVTFWHNSVFFIGLAIVGIFFTAIQYAAHAGWSAILKRVPEAFGSFLPYAAVLLVATFAWGYHEIFHWTDKSLMDPNSPNFDYIIAGKGAYLNMPFFISRMLIFILGWYIFYHFLRKNSLAEDIEGGTHRFWKMKVISTLFIIFFAITTSMAAWDWVMSIDTHWFSTMFGWYTFASWFVAGLAAITLAVLYLKDAGYLKAVNESHLHDLGKFVFAFSVFWTYIWFSQFLLIYYANIPEETIYFVERLRSEQYAKFIFINLFLNFFFPFLALMTRDAKRKAVILKIVCYAVIIGHWLDFYLMVTPGTLKENGGLGPLEIGLALIYCSMFAYVIAQALTKAPLVAKNHPMLQESLHHNI
ncbi:quinol:cytochrome C oxidoreductase [Rhodoflexus sp.]